MSRNPLNKLFRRDVQCRDQSVIEAILSAPVLQQGKYEEEKKKF
jgi:hypothetical protein